MFLYGVDILSFYELTANDMQNKNDNRAAYPESPFALNNKVFTLLQLKVFVK